MKIRCLAPLAVVTLFAMEARATETWVQSSVNGHWYAVTKYGFDWATARTYAQSFGGDLATIRDAMENQWILSALAPTAPYYIGYTDAAVEGTWSWASGDPATYTNWELGEPNNANGGEDFAMYRPNGSWNDVAGDELAPAILEVVNGPPGPGADVPLIGTWVQSPNNGLWYAPTLVGLTWPQAKAFADTMAGDLATIRNATENGWIRANMLQGAARWIGFSDEVTEANWLWDSGDPSTYANWAAGEPNNSGNEDYASITTNGTWNDLPETQSLSAIIERVAPPGISYFGVGCAGSGGFTPKVSFSGGTQSGSVVTLDVQDALGGSQLFLLMSGSTASIPISPFCTLNLGLPLFPAIIGPINLGGTGPGAGSISLFAALPPIPFNATIGLQAIVADPGVPSGLSTTSALVMMLQP